MNDEANLVLSVDCRAKWLMMKFYLTVAKRKRELNICMRTYIQNNIDYQRRQATVTIIIVPVVDGNDYIVC